MIFSDCGKNSASFLNLMDFLANCEKTSDQLISKHKKMFVLSKKAP